MHWYFVWLNGCVRVPHLTGSKLQAVVSWLLELNSGPLEEQSLLLTTEPSLQPQTFFNRELFTFYLPYLPTKITFTKKTKKTKKKKQKKQVITVLSVSLLALGCLH
jgi:hypothetical protein